MDRRSFQAAARCSSQVSLTPSRSRFSDLSRSRCTSLSNSYMVVNVSSMRSVSSGDKLRLATAVYQRESLLELEETRATDLS